MNKTLMGTFIAALAALTLAAAAPVSYADSKEMRTADQQGPDKTAAGSTNVEGCFDCVKDQLDSSHNAPTKHVAARDAAVTVFPAGKGGDGSGSSTTVREGNKGP